ncbi:MAG: hypothetical protein HQ581_23710 [Planctomycetes bacterium]|nr:hypothetical protein [Planctomycetota bacterium]
MAKPTPADMRTSLEDARFFYEKLNLIIRGPEQGQDLELVRRYFRAYLHCWKCVPHFVREVKGLSMKRQAWSEWTERWARSLNPSDSNVFECLRKTRDHDTHQGMIEVNGEIAAGLFPIVMFQPGKGSGPRRELISCCDRGLFVADHMIREFPNVT